MPLCAGTSKIQAQVRTSKEGNVQRRAVVLILLVKIKLQARRHLQDSTGSRYWHEETHDR